MLQIPKRLSQTRISRPRGRFIMKRLCLLVFLLLLMILAPVASFAYSSDSKPENDYSNNGNYYETIITNGSDRYPHRLPQTFSQTKKLKNKFKKSKIAYYKNASGKKLWYVKVTGTFTYRNGIVQCIGSTVTAKALSSSWKCTKKTTWKKNNKASAKATFTHYLNGSPKETLTRTVTLTCNSKGQFSLL